MCVLVIPYTHGAVRHRAPVLGRGVGIKPLGRAGHVRQRNAILGVRVELRAIRNHQTLAHGDYRGGGNRGQGKLACGAVVGERVVRPLDQWAFSGYRCNAIRCEDARALNLRRRVAHPAGRAVGQPVDERCIVGVGLALVLRADDKIAPLRQTHRRRAGLRHRESRRQRKFADQARAIDDVAFCRDEFVYRTTVVQKAHLQRVIHAIDVERRGVGRGDDGHTVRTPVSGWCRIGTRVQVVRGFLVIQREREGQRTGWHAVHGKYQHHVELDRNQGGIADLKIPMLKRP